MRTLPTMVGIELVNDRRTREPYEFAARKGFEVCQAARRRGVLLRPLGNVVVLMPPLSLTLEEAALLTDVVAEAIESRT